MSLTFMERNRVVIGLVTLALILAGTIGALVVEGGRFRSGYEVTADFADAAGLLRGDDVLIAGIRAGEVRDMQLADGVVRVTVFIEEHELPRDTRAEIVLRTLVGRRSLELLPGDDWAEVLADGDHIPAERTRIPEDVPDFGEVAEELLPELDTDALNTFFGAVTEVARGQRTQVEALVEGGTRLTSIVNEQEQEVLVLLDRLHQVSRALAERDEEIVRIIDDFGLVVGELAERREDLRRLIRETNRSARLAADLVGDERARISGILDEVHQLTGVLSRNQMNLAEGLAYSGQSIFGFSEVAWSGEVPVPWANQFVTALGPAGVDVLVGCGGLVDRQLDDIFGPDPRPCEEQEHDTFPDDVEQPEHGQGIEVPSLPTSSQRFDLRALADRALLGGEPS
jgi:phospholipid/cholesterol/gamma-HCH transport system substrate-binding protein